MARGINKVFLMGNLGQDPAVRSTATGQCVAQVTLATSSGWRDKEREEWHEQTEWHRLVCFNRLAEITRDHLQKGTRIYVEGSLRTRKWSDKNGMDRYTTEIVVNDLHILRSPPATGNVPDCSHEKPASASSAEPYGESADPGRSDISAYDDPAEWDEALPV